MMRVVIVEDQAMLLDSLALAIEAQEDMAVVGRLADASLALDVASRQRADLVLMDVCTQDGNSGISATRRIKEALPEVRVVVMTGVPEVTFVEQARTAGADSFVYKNVNTAELLSVMRSTMDGYITFPRPRRDAPTGIDALTETEMAILRLVCEAKSRREVAAELCLSEGTVKRHVSEILAKTGYDSILRLAVNVVADGSVVLGLKDGV